MCTVTCLVIPHVGRRSFPPSCDLATLSTSTLVPECCCCCCPINIIDGTVEIHLLGGVALSSSSSSSSASHASKGLSCLPARKLRVDVLLVEELWSSTSLPKREPDPNLVADALAEYDRKRPPHVSESGQPPAWLVVSRSKKLGKKRRMRGFKNGPHAAMMARLTSTVDDVPPTLYVGSGSGGP